MTKNYTYGSKTYIRTCPKCKRRHLTTSKSKPAICIECCKQPNNAASIKIIGDYK